MQGLVVVWVVDASVATKWVVDEEGSDKAASLAGEDLAAPDLMLTECANVLWVKTRRGELEANEARERIQALATAPLRWTPQHELIDAALNLALALSHPVYDCLYLALAVRRAAPLVTADHRFVKAVQQDDELTSRIILLDELAIG